MKTLADLDYDELQARAAEAARLPALDDDGDDYEYGDEPEETDDEDLAEDEDDDEAETRSAFGKIAVTTDPWLRERANMYLRGLPDPPQPIDALRKLDDETLELVLLTAVYEISLEQRHLRAFDPNKHKRWLKPHPLAGKFRPMLDLLKAAIREFDPKKDKHPFELFTRPQLMKAAKARGITLKRGEDRDSIADKVLADLKPEPVAKPKAAPKKAAAPRSRKPKPLTPEQELAQWKADASKPGRVEVASTGPTKREYYVASWEAGIARVRKEITQVKKNGPKSRLPDLEKDLERQIRLRDHWRDNPDPSLDEPFAGPTFELAQKVDPARPLAVYGDVLHMEGSDDAWTHLNMTELARIPAELHAVVAAHMAAKADGGIWIGDTAVSQMNHSHDLAGVTPRGWGDDKTWDDVNGAYRPDRRILLVGRTANSEHRGDKTASHEFGHALDNALGRSSHDRDWEAIHARALTEYISPYYRQSDEAGRQEFWAEAFSTWVTARQQRPGYETTAKYIIRLDVSGETGNLIHEYFNRVAAKWGVV